MSKDNLIAFQAGESSTTFRDALTELVRKGARQIIVEAVEAELQEFLAQYQDLKDEQGRRAVVRNGYLPERTIVTGVGQVEVQVPKVRDRTHNGIKFNSSLLPPYLKRAQSVEEVLPWLYLKGISTGDFSEALASLLGANAQGLSATTVSRLKTKWIEEHQQWQRRSLLGKRYVYMWADGIYFNVRDESDRQCILVIIGVSDTGVKELLGLEAGLRESELSWKPLLLRLQDHGLQIAPELTIADGSLGFWKALAGVFPTTKAQRCWVHKANVLNKLPKTQQAQAKCALHKIYLAATKDEANKAFERFIKTYEAKYPLIGRVFSQGPSSTVSVLRFSR